MSAFGGTRPLSSAYQVAKPKKSRTVTKDRTRPKADDGDEDRFKSFYRHRQNFCLLDAVQRFALRRQA